MREKAYLHQADSPHTELQSHKYKKEDVPPTLPSDAQEATEATVQQALHVLGCSGCIADLQSECMHESLSGGEGGGEGGKKVCEEGRRTWNTL